MLRRLAPLLIILILFIITYIIVNIPFKYNKKFKILCKNLNIDKYFQKRLNEKYFNSLYSCVLGNDCDRVFKETIMYYYSNIVMDDIRLYKYNRSSSKSKYFNAYFNSHKMDIKNLETLLNDYTYKNNKFLFENIIYLGQVLKEPFMVIDNIDKLDITKSEKVQEINYIESKIFKTYDNFFDMVNKLYKEYTLTLNETKIISEKTKIFDGLDLYNDLLINIVEDIDNKQGVF